MPLSFVVQQIVRQKIQMFPTLGLRIIAPTGGDHM
jgi:hypothetical protein